MKEEIKKIIEDLSNNKELCNKLKNVKSESEGLSIIKEFGYNITSEDIKQYKEDMLNNSQMSDKELKNVSGGTICIFYGNGDGRTEFCIIIGLSSDEDDSLKCVITGWE